MDNISKRLLVKEYWKYSKQKYNIVDVEIVELDSTEVITMLCRGHQARELINMLKTNEDNRKVRCVIETKKHNRELLKVLVVGIFEEWETELIKQIKESKKMEQTIEEVKVPVVANVEVKIDHGGFVINVSDIISVTMREVKGVDVLRVSWLNRDGGAKMSSNCKSISVARYKETDVEYNDHSECYNKFMEINASINKHFSQK